MDENRENYLKELMELRKSLGYSKMRDLDLIDAVFVEFDGQLTLEEVNTAMGLVYSCWLKDETGKPFNQYAYAINEFKKEEQKSFEELKDMDAWDLLEEIYDYVESL